MRTGQSTLLIKYPFQSGERLGSDGRVACYWRAGKVGSTGATATREHVLAGWRREPVHRYR